MAMQALFELTDGLRKLKDIIGSFPPESPHWNEAQNRFQFVDRLLTECLGFSALLKAQEESFLSVHQFIERGKKQRRARRD
jgi:hypothetical protein